MRIKQIELTGFKSFVDQTTLELPSGVTGIVGPNGCGKSNIVDAIRWVLGEQKTSMIRSEKMENVIFNGTKQRKASSLAEVSQPRDSHGTTAGLLSNTPARLYGLHFSECVCGQLPLGLLT